MKKLSIFILALFTSVSFFAQAPHAFNYQGVARELSGEPMPNQDIGLKITILENTTDAYIETHSVTTNNLGLFNIRIGEGMAQSGIFADIDWGNDDHFLQIEMDETGGTNYDSIGTSQLLSVPYALYAKNAYWSKNGDDLYYESGSVGIGTDNPDATAILDLRSSSKGLLVPRLTPAQRNAIASPANGLLVFEPEGRIFWFFDGLQWVNLNGGSGGDNLGNHTATQMLDMNGQPIENMADPINGQDAATKNYVDNNDDVDDADADPTNEIQSLSLAGSNLTISNGNTVALPTLPPSTNTLIEDADQDTKIQVEESPDEDIIRFDIGGEEKMVLTQNANGATRLELLDSGSNTVIGSQAGMNINHSFSGQSFGFANTFMGWRAGNGNTDGRSNTFIGYRAGDNTTTGSWNTFIGGIAGWNNTTGSANVAMGFQSLNFNTSGSNNTAIGNNAMYENTTGDNNTAIGKGALVENTTGSHNTAIGENSLPNNTSGSRNITIGNVAMRDNTTGSNNTAIGYLSLFENDTLHNNTALGFYAGGFETFSNSSFMGRDAYPDSSGYSNCTGIGYQARPTAANSVRLGNSSINSIGGFADWTNLSDSRFKENIRQDVKGLEFILKLNPVTYTLDVNVLSARLKEDQTRDEDGNIIMAEPDATTRQSRLGKSNIRYSGFLAQEVKQIAEETGFDFSGVDAPKDESGLYGLRYATFTVPLVKAVQEQQKIIEAQNDKIRKLENIYREQQSDIETLKAQVEKLISEN